MSASSDAERSDDIRNSLAHPPDLEHIHDNLLDLREDTATQNEVFQAVINNPLHCTEKPTKLFDQAAIPLSLDSLAKISNDQHKQRAIELLRKRHELTWKDSRYCIPATEPSLTWNFTQHYIDMVVCVGRGLGLSMILPPERPHMYEFNCDFRRPQRGFAAKFAQLGFDAKGSLLWIGRCGGEDVWIGWAPTDSLRGESDVEPGTMSGATNLRTEHYRLTVLFFAHVIVQVGHRGVTLFTPYPDLKSEEAFNNSTDVQ